jgi:hypothetical protein
MSTVIGQQPQEYAYDAKKVSFGELKQIDAGLLNVGYVEAVPPAGNR